MFCVETYTTLIGKVQNHLPCLVQGAFCWEFGCNRPQFFIPALHSHPLLLITASYFPLGTIYSTVSGLPVSPQQQFPNTLGDFW